MSDQPIQVNRALVLTLWATVVAEALGHPPRTALTLGRYVAGSSARIMAKSIGMMDEGWRRQNGWHRRRSRPINDSMRLETFN